MKRDWNLIRKILLAAADKPPGQRFNPKFEGYGQEEVGHHSHYIVNEGLARGCDVQNNGNFTPQRLITSLTFDGHDFADLVRDETRWDEAMAQTLGSGGSISIASLRDLLVKLAVPTASKSRKTPEMPASLTSWEGEHGNDASNASLQSSEQPELGSVDKGNLHILKAGGVLKTAVTVETASRFGGVTTRAIWRALEKGGLESEGTGPNRRVVVASLLKYFPPENES